MQLALDEARAAADAGEVPIGALLVLNGSIVARAGNRTIRDTDPTAHAEMVVLREGARFLGNYRLAETVLYVTLEPCAMCAGAISLARLRRLYYGASDPKSGGVEHGARVVSHATCHHAPEVYGGIGETESASLLKTFFAARR